MKTKIFFLASLFLAGSFVACNNQDEPTPGPAAQGEQTLAIKIPADLLSPAETRAIEDQQAQGKTTIDDVTVFLMIGEVVYEAKTHIPEDFDASGYIRYEQIPGNINNVIVVANKVGEAIDGLTTASAIRKYAYTVASQHMKTGLAGKTLMGEVVPQTASDPAPHPGINPPHDYKLAEVELHSLTSRIEVGAVKNGTGLKEVKLLGVYINNYYPTYAKASVIRNLGTPASVWGVTNSNSSQMPGVPTAAAIGNITIDTSAYTEPDYVLKADDTQVYLNDASKVYAFHTFSGNVPHLILLIKGEYETGYYEIEGGSHKKFFYGWVTYTKFKISGTQYADPFMPNKIYKMGVGASGIVISHTDIYPEPEITPYDLGLEIEVVDWIPENVTPEL